MMTFIQRLPLGVLIAIAAVASTIWEIFKVVFPPLYTKRLNS